MCISALRLHPGTSGGVQNLGGSTSGISQSPTFVSLKSPVLTAYSRMPMYLLDSLPTFDG